MRLLFVLGVLLGAEARAADPSIYSGIGGGAFDREENFEVLQSPDAATKN